MVLFAEAQDKTGGLEEKKVMVQMYLNKTWQGEEM